MPRERLIIDVALERLVGKTSGRASVGDEDELFCELAGLPVADERVVALAREIEQRGRDGMSPGSWDGRRDGESV